MARIVPLTGIILILLLSGISFSQSKGEEGSAQILTVDDDGTADYLTIQDAIDHATNGDTIYVYNGTYYEDLYIQCSLSLQGESNKHTILKTNGNTNHNIEFPLYTNTSGGIHCHSSVSIQGFRFDDFCIGLFHYNNTILDNVMNSSCILIYGEDSKISGNIIRNNSDDCGLFIFESRSNISRNIIEGNQYGLILMQDGHVVEKNLFSQNEYGLVLYPYCFLFWYENSSGGVMVRGNSFIENTCGLFLYRYLIFLASWSHINNNNFIGNVQHARFLVNILKPFSQPNSIKTFPLIKNEPMNDRWIGNYWDDYCCIGSKVITGKIGLFCVPENIESISYNQNQFISPIFTPYFGGIPFINVDWYPAAYPYDI